MKIVTIEQMRQIEQASAGIGLSSPVLMENAGKAVAEAVRRILGKISQQPVLFLIGPGNNGGDGIVAARHLSDWGAKVSLCLCSERAEDTNLRQVRERGLTLIEATEDKNLDRFREMLSSATCVVDALFGTGKVRPFQDVVKQILELVAAATKTNKSLHLVALDLPSGLNADNGEVDPATLYADDTITLGFPKLGLFSFPGAERVGRMTVVDIGIPAHLAESVNTELMTTEWAKAVLPRRPLNANKGTFGKVMVVAGSINYIGAAYLACNGALRVGVGLVTLATARSLQPILASKLSEVTYFPLPEHEAGIISPQAAVLLGEQLNQYGVLLLGCGLGQSLPAMKFVGSLLVRPELPTLVLDADALNTFARIPKWWQELTCDAIITPHAGEMARLCGLSVESVQSDRVGIARKMAMEWHKTIVLKGAYTVIAAPDGRCLISPFANPGLASAGTGDVLAGAIAGLLAQGLSLFDAAVLGVYLHAEAGEMVKGSLGDSGMTASDLLPVLPMVIKRLKDSR